MRDFERAGRGWFWETNNQGTLSYVSQQLADDFKSERADLLGRLAGDKRIGLGKKALTAILAESHRFVGAALDEAGERTRDVGRTITVAVRAAGEGAVSGAIVRARAQGFTRDHVANCGDVVFIYRAVFRSAANQFRNVVTDGDGEGVG